MDTIPSSDSVPSVADKLAYAEMYLKGGWHLFVVNSTKICFPMCNGCRNAGPDHDRENCGHLLCHGFYAATNDIDRIRKMFVNHPDGHLALRTGQPSGVFALDFEAHAAAPELPTGNEVHDAWESFTGIEIPETLMARSASGGLHRLYKTDEVVPGRPRLLPSTDLKAEGGYIVLPPAPGRRWLTNGPLAEAPENLLEWLRYKKHKESTAWNSKTTGLKVGHAHGYDFNLFFREGCPGGYRDDFVNDLLFRLRKRGKTIEEAASIAESAWRRVAQPPYAKYFMPWSDVEYKLLRVWQTVKPDPIPDTIRRWAAQAQSQTGGTR